MDVVGELESEVERFEDGLVVDLVASEEVFSSHPLAADAFLFFSEDVVADRVGVVGVEEFPFFVVESSDFGSPASGFFVGDLGEVGEVGADHSSDAFALRGGGLDGCVVALDCRFDCFGAL